MRAGTTAIAAMVAAISRRCAEVLADIPWLAGPDSQRNSRCESPRCAPGEHV
eukprot:CAMPEP_0206016114 /NCGR_PEP_ID=MMETSP1464-20131121/21966_1 /ASSEMBLY_ACC=CAM_ASM_001124 /TAXON_ID=119497 /ORGANISM="Exanthemachrysis gayraliae, Strain RCC1523" /LENGTH=51 /DNA_ID=CAMNT_0053389921 /DNA_START=31 /DNA_END=183 /DNA_ORIENTATION=+